MWSRIKSILDQNQELALTAIGSEAIAADLFHVMNYIQIVNNGVKSTRTNKGGIYLKE